MDKNKIIRGKVPGTRDKIYEAILLESLNQSEVMLGLNNGEKYKAPLSQENKQPDALGIDAEHSIDFKLLTSQTECEITSLNDGYVVRNKDTLEFVEIRQDEKKIERMKVKHSDNIEYKQLKNSETYKFFKKNRIPFTISIFSTLNKNSEIMDDLDYEAFIKIMKTEKNILLFYPKSINKDIMNVSKDDYKSYDNYKYLLDFRPKGMKTYFCHLIIEESDSPNKIIINENQSQNIFYNIYINYYECKLEELIFLNKINITNLKTIPMAFKSCILE